MSEENRVDSECIKGRDIACIPTFNAPVMYILNYSEISYEYLYEGKDKHDKVYREWRSSSYKMLTDELPAYILDRDTRKQIFDMRDELSINHKYIGRLLYNKFIPPNQIQVFIRKNVPLIYNYENNLEFRNIIVTYYVYEVREEIIPFLEHMECDDKVLIEDLRIAFTKGNCNTLKEYIERKAKYLNELNMDDYVKLLNEETQQKQKVSAFRNSEVIPINRKLKHKEVK